MENVPLCSNSFSAVGWTAAAAVEKELGLFVAGKTFDNWDVGAQTYPDLRRLQRAASRSLRKGYDSNTELR